MELGLPVFIRAFTVLLLGSSLPCSVSRTDFVLEDFDKKLLALSRVVDYIQRRPQQMNTDATFGLTIAEANIASTLLHENSRSLGQKRLGTLRMLLAIYDIVRRYLVTHATPKDGNVRLLHMALNNPELWIRGITWRRVANSRPRPSPDLSYRTVGKLLMQGTPNETQSDGCLAEIVRRKFSGECRRMPEACVNILVERDQTRGYPLNHRLLIVSVARAVKFLPTPISINCLGNETGYDDLVNSYCTAILQDLIDVETIGFPYTTRDLMMEQAVLCGMEGFLEFTGKHYEDLVLGWSNHSGCYSSFGSRRSPIVPVRRSSLPTDFGCDNHATGLAAAVLSLYVRENVENGLGKN